jgi:hypothetical protein
VLVNIFLLRVDKSPKALCRRYFIGGNSNDECKIPAIDRHLRGQTFWTVHNARVKAITAMVHQRWAQRDKAIDRKLAVRSLKVKLLDLH